MIDFACPHCGHPMHVKDEAAGQSGSCKKCRKAVTVPSPAKPSPVGIALAILTVIVGLASGTVVLCCGANYYFVRTAKIELMKEQEERNEEFSNRERQKANDRLEQERLEKRLDL